MSDGRVLIVDDDLHIQRMLRRSLRGPFEVIVEGPVEAMARLDAGERFHVILCDLIMDEMSGVEFYRQTEAISRELATRIIFYTGDNNKSILGLPNLCIEKTTSIPVLRWIISERLAQLADKP